MKTIPTSQIPRTQISELDEIANRVAAPELREFLLTISHCVSSGAELTAAIPNESVSPNDAAALLGMSRTHLYKLLDNGDVPSFNVGTHRRIYVRDLVAFRDQRDAARRELAAQFAAQRHTESAAIDELAEML